MPKRESSEPLFCFLVSLLVLFCLFFGLSCLFCVVCVEFTASWFGVVCLVLLVLIVVCYVSDAWFVGGLVGCFNIFAMCVSWLLQEDAKLLKCGLLMFDHCLLIRYLTCF